MDDSKLIERLKNKFKNRWLAVELTNVCNLRCPLCSTGSGFNQKPKGRMSLDNFRKFMDMFDPLTDSVEFVGSGEPMLHPQFIEFINYVTKHKKKITRCFSNGTQLKNSEKIVKSGLHEIHIDIDGLTQAQHSKYRIGSNLETVLTNIKNLIQTKRKFRSYYPEIYIDTLINCYNEHDYDAFIEMAKQLGVNGICFQSMIDDLFDTTDWFPTSEKFRHVKCEPKGECFYNNTIVGILSWDGDIQLCCMTPHHKEPLVKLNAFNEDNILEKMDSDQFHSLTKRAGHYKFCQTCFLNIYESYHEIIKFKKSRIDMLMKYKNHRSKLVRFITDSLQPILKFDVFSKS